VRLWDPRTGKQQAVLDGHRDKVLAVCAVTAGGRELLASGGEDDSVRVWDPRTGTCLATVPVYHPALAVAWGAGPLAIGLQAGILVIKLDLAA
jgi:WD40 repeat protein